ncbi:MAG: Uma2 family endonuclease [Spirosomaceae bacterium]|jgi:Uma2 family endonuclease|nr:Uma2 family endonuclease [Spirosomataceae bacterium]
MTGQIAKINSDEKVGYNGFKLSDEEFFEFCIQHDNLTFERNADGTIVTMPNTGGKTGNLNFELSIEFGLWNRIYQQGKCFDSSTAFRLPSSAVRSPDVAWVNIESWNSLTERQREQFPPVCPDFVIELMSATDDLKAAQLKMTNEWIANGCRLAWLIDPQNETVYIYRGNGEVQIVKGFDKTLTGEDVLVDFELPLAKLRA